ncbi:MAG: sigma-70 family RNA polymerase sigma factor [Blastocatellia bacterium]
MTENRARAEVFEQMLLPHLAAAYNLARWITRNDHDAEDVVQEAYLRAFKYFGRFQGGDGRAWLLKIVRNTCFTWLERNRPRELAHLDEEEYDAPATTPSPEADVIEGNRKEMLNDALEELPAEFREVLILREMEGFSYKEISDITGVPIGTVMSRLARARRRLQVLFSASGRGEKL